MTGTRDQPADWRIPVVDGHIAVVENNRHEPAADRTFWEQFHLIEGDPVA